MSGFRRLQILAGVIFCFDRKRPGNPFGPAAFSCQYYPLRGEQRRRFWRSSRLRLATCRASSIRCTSTCFG